MATTMTRLDHDDLGPVIPDPETDRRARNVVIGHLGDDAGDVLAALGLEEA